MRFMLAEPVDFDRAGLARVLADEWDIRVAKISYVALGFGTHHWRVDGRDDRSWFVNADTPRHPGPDSAQAQTQADAVLERTLRAAIALRNGGLEFVHAPVPRRTGAVTVSWHGYAISVYSFVDGQGYPYGDFPDMGLRRDVLHLLGRLHAATVPSGLLRVDDLEVPGRTELAALDLHTRWSGGPYAEPARELLVAAQPRLAQLWRRYDDLLPAVWSTSDGWVPTHGEPHAGNVMTTRDRSVLVDWDTLLIAPRERDLWRTQPFDPGDRAAYGDGPAVDETAVALYRLRWDLADICAFAADLHAPHVDDENTRLASQCLRDYLT
jgi:hypothetical protein